MRLILLWFFIVFSCALAQAQPPSCFDLFAKPKAPRLLESLSLPVIALKDITPEEVKRFSNKDSGALSLLLKSNLKNHKDGLNVLLLVMLFRYTQRDVYESPLARDFSHLTETGLLQKAKNGDWSSKIKAARLIKSFEALLKSVQDPQMEDLLTAKGWLYVFGADSADDFYQALNRQHTGLVHSNERLNLDETADPQLVVKDHVIQFANEAFALEMLAAKKTGFLFSVRLPAVAKEVPQWIKKLHLPRHREAFYLDVYRFNYEINLVTSRGLKEHQMTRHYLALHIFLKAYLEAFPNKKPESSSVLATSVFLNSAFQHATRFDRLYQWNESRIEESLNRATALNQRLELFLEDVTAALQSTQAVKDPEIREAISNLWVEASHLEARDLGVSLVMEYDERLSRLNRLHFQLDHLMEQRVVPQQEEDIRSFYDLNFKWSRLISERSYEIQGRDFDRVVFRKEVVNYFAKNAVIGDRFLAAINKGYVSAHNENGLRTVHEIHKDFRYVKVLKSGGKIRILGKLVDRELHLFEVYNRDETFDMHEIRRKIDRFSLE